MNMYDIIMKKRDGGKLSKAEIAYVVTDYTNGTIPDYQMAAFLMAVYFKGMDAEETTNLTMAMADSGDRLDLSKIHGIKVDKHSTGGVGDKTSLIVGPILASLGVPVAKMSGRGLGHTGGTIDKLEGIPGFQTAIREEDFMEQVNQVGLAIVGQTANLAPADKKIYALRDVTATVDNISLIAASIMSKKLAAGADKIVLDVKCGTGAFMKNLEDAGKLAKTMVSIGTMAGKETVALITDMNEPLGNFVGNILEVKEAIACLNGQGEHRLMEVSKALAIQMLLLANQAQTKEQAAAMVDDSISSGKAFSKLKEFVKYQGGDISYMEDVSQFDKAEYKKIIYGKDLLTDDRQEGYLESCNTQEVGMVSLVLGGGRRTKDSKIDLTVGLELKKHLGDRINTEDEVAVLYGNQVEQLEEAAKRFFGAYVVSNQPVERNPIVYDVITKNDLTTE